MPKKTTSTGTTPLLRPDPHNLRKHEDKSKTAIRASLEDVGPFRSIAVDGDNIVRGGNGVYEQAQALGLKVTVVDAQPDELIAVRRKDLKGKEAERAAIWDNAVQERSEWDVTGLAELAEKEKDLLAGIFSDAEQMAFIRRREADVYAAQDPDEFTITTHDDRLEKIHKQWKVKPGQIYRIGDLGRVACGDSTDPELLKKFLRNPETLDGIFTSPPYAEQRTKQYGGQSVAVYLEWWKTVQAALKPYLKKNGSFFINIKPHADKGQRVLYVFDLVLAMVREHGWNYIEELCWLKQAIPGDFKTRFKNAFEPVYQFSQSLSPQIFKSNVATYGKGTFKGAGAKIYSGSGQDALAGAQAVQKSGLILPSNVVKASMSFEGTGHAAAFPLALALFFVRAYSPEGGVWLDPFSGSGTTLLAAIQEKRVGLGIELKPEYVSLTLNRCHLAGYDVQLEK